jgi:hypothetical protein
MVFSPHSAMKLTDQCRIVAACVEGARLTDECRMYCYEAVAIAWACRIPPCMAFVEGALSYKLKHHAACDPLCDHRVRTKVRSPREPQAGQL